MEDNNIKTEPSFWEKLFFNCQKGLFIGYLGFAITAWFREMDENKIGLLTWYSIIAFLFCFFYFLSYLTFTMKSRLRYIAIPGMAIILFLYTCFFAVLLIDAIQNFFTTYQIK